MKIESKSAAQRHVEIWLLLVPLYLKERRNMNELLNEKCVKEKQL